MKEEIELHTFSQSDNIEAAVVTDVRPPFGQATVIFKMLRLIYKIRSEKPSLANLWQLTAYAYFSDIWGLCLGFASARLADLSEAERLTFTTYLDQMGRMSSKQMSELVKNGDITIDGKKFVLKEFVSCYKQVRFWQYLQLDRDFTSLYLQTSGLTLLNRGSRTDFFYNLEKIFKGLLTHGNLWQINLGFHAISAKKEEDGYYLYDSNMDAVNWIGPLINTTELAQRVKNFYKMNLPFSCKVIVKSLEPDALSKIFDEHVAQLLAEKACPLKLKEYIQQYLDKKISQNSLIEQIILLADNSVPEELLNYFICILNDRSPDPNRDLNTLLFDAVSVGKTTAVKLLIQAGANWNWLQSTNETKPFWRGFQSCKMTALHAAFYYENAEESAAIILQTANLKDIAIHCIEAARQGNVGFIKGMMKSMMTGDQFIKRPGFRSLWTNVAFTAVRSDQLAVLTLFPAWVFQEILRSDASKTIHAKVLRVVLHKIDRNYPLKQGNNWHRFMCWARNKAAVAPSQIIGQMGREQYQEWGSVLEALHVNVPQFSKPHPPTTARPPALQLPTKPPQPPGTRTSFVRP